MATVNANRLMERLRKTVLYDGTARTDGQLLNSFVQDKDDAAPIQPTGSAAGPLGIRHQRASVVKTSPLASAANFSSSS